MKPGARVTVHYRIEPGRFRHVGTVLAQSDVRAWAGTVCFPTPNPDPDAVRRHVERCADEGLMQHTPVLWDFGHIYWEPTDKLVEEVR